MDRAGWATFGFGSTVALTTVMAAAQLMGLTRMDLPMMLGTIAVEDPDRARVIGFVIHLVNGQLFGLLYAGAFAVLGEATWWWGALFGTFHGVAALVLLVPLLPGIHPRMASARGGPSLESTLEPPGLLGLNYGVQTPLVTLLAHVVYGILLGTLLSPG